MTNASRGRKLAAALAGEHRAPMMDDERDRVEQMLGPGAIAFKLDPAGTRRLFRALDRARGAQADKAADAAPAKPAGTENGNRT